MRRVSLLVLSALAACSDGSSGTSSSGGTVAAAATDGSASTSSSVGTSGAATSTSTSTTTSSGSTSHGASSGTTSSHSSSSSSSGTTSGAVVPPAAADAGYLVNTFSTVFDTTTVDITNSGAKGFDFYPWNIFYEHTKLSAIALNGDGSVTLAGDTTGPNGELASITPSTSAAKFVGTAFGGGAYFEATFSFNPSDTFDAGFKGWPSWWALSLDELINLPDAYWYGTNPDAGYMHDVENDFFEYDASGTAKPGQTNYYGSSLHDWYGVYDTTCAPAGFCVANDTHSGLRTAPANTDLTQPHRYGCLWIPATATTEGSATYYFDDLPVGTPFQWQKYADEPPPVTSSSPWLFSWMDVEHYYLILGTGVDEPMTVQSVAVWQVSDANNLHQ